MQAYVARLAHAFSRHSSKKVWSLAVAQNTVLTIMSGTEARRGMSISNIKERLLGAITVMDEANAARLWEYLLGLSGNRWDSVEEEDPDEVDLNMIQEAESDPDCQIFR